MGAACARGSLHMWSAPCPRRHASWEGTRAARVHRACSLGGCPATAVLAALGPDLLRCANHSRLENSLGRMMQSAIVNCTTDFLAGALYAGGQEGSFLATDSVRAPPLERGPRAPYCPKMRSHATLGRSSKTAELPRRLAGPGSMARPNSSTATSCDAMRTQTEVAVSPRQTAGPSR